MKKITLVLSAGQAKYVKIFADKMDELLDSSLNTFSLAMFASHKLDKPYTDNNGNEHEYGRDFNPSGIALVNIEAMQELDDDEDDQELEIEFAPFNRVDMWNGLEDDIARNFMDSIFAFNFPKEKPAKDKDKKAAKADKKKSKKK